MILFSVLALFYVRKSVDGWSKMWDYLMCVKIGEETYGNLKFEVYGGIFKFKNHWWVLGFTSVFKFSKWYLSAIIWDQEVVC